MRDTAELVAAELAAVKRATIAAADAMRGVERGVDEAVELARRNGFTIYDSGEVSLGPPCRADEPADVVETRRRVRVELIDRVEQTLRHANDIDADVCKVLQRVLDGDLVDVTTNNAAQGTELSAYVGAGEALGSLSILSPPPPGASASDNAAWWATLSDQERKQLILDRPALVGPRDGVATTARDAANRALLGRERTQVEQEIADLEEQLADTSHGPGADYDRDRLTEQIEAAKDKLGGIEAIEERLEENAGAPPGQEYYLLGIDGGGDGQAIIAKGNPDTATNVATYVPGTGANLAGIEGGMARSDDMFNAAEKAGSGSTSVITWYGYDAPDDVVPDAMSGDYAEQATRDLDSFQNGLRASHDDALPPAHNTALGHSYGTTVIGYAAQEGNGLDVDEMVFVGSPGVGADNASAMNMPDGHVWATADPDDIVPDTQAHGNDPTDDDFGAREFQADAPGKEGNWYEGGYNTSTHSDYWETGNPAIRGMGRIIAGKSVG